MLWDTFPEELDQLTLQDAYLSICGDPSASMPFWIWLFENPDSPLSLPGKINLYRHDCLHLLLKKGFHSAGEAYVIGFTMGNDPSTRWLHFTIIKLVTQFLYPHPYRFSKADIEYLNAGFAHGKGARVKGLNQAPFERWQTMTLIKLRQFLEI
jgi:hypothetical protein